MTFFLIQEISHHSRARFAKNMDKCARLKRQKHPGRVGGGEGEVQISET